MKNKEILNKMYLEARANHEGQVHQMIKDTMAKIKANKTKLQNLKDGGLYSSSEVKSQETKTRELNAQLLAELREDLGKIKAKAIDMGKQKDIELGKFGDLEVANMLSVLAITAKTIKEQDLINMYFDGYFNPMVKIGIEAIAAERGYTLQKPTTAAETAQQSFIDSIKSFTGALTPVEINANFEVLSSVMRLTKNEIAE